MNTIIAIALSGCAGLADPAAPNDAATGSVDFDGIYRLTWLCGHNCALPAPALVYSRRLEIRGAELRWFDEDCAECEHNDAGEIAGVCIDVAAQVAGIDQLAAYGACADTAGALEVSISATRIGGAGLAVTWQATGERASK